MKEQITKNPMATEPVEKILLKMSIPVILSMMLQAAYNIVDSMFVANMPDYDGIVNAGEMAVNALTLAFPVQMLFVAFGIGTGVGMGAALSRVLGAGKKDEAAHTAGNGIFLGIIMYVIFFLFGLFGIDAYLKLQSNNETVIQMAGSYLRICTLLCLGNIMFGIFEKMLQSTGKTQLSTIAQVTGALTNVVLDPILIYGLAGLPALGIKGAAIATVIGQFVSFFMALYLQIFKNKEIALDWKYLKPDSRIIGNIYSIGLPAIIMQALMSFMTFAVNMIYVGVSESAVTAYGIFYKIQQFIYFAGFGIRDAITPLVAYNYGMGSESRVKKAIKYGLIYITIVMLIGVALMEFGGEGLASIFNLADYTESLCVRAMKIIAIGFVFAGINIALQGVFQAMEAGVNSLIISVLRLFLVPLGLSIWFARLSNADFAIWFAFPIGEIIAAIVAVVLVVRLFRNTYMRVRM